jgi:predicted NBD/HSP70 family sugar kinase
MKLKSWRGTEQIVVGGGFSLPRVGELVIGRADLILKDEKLKLDLRPIRFHPDEAALLGALHLVPSWIFEGHDGILAVDIGGTNFRAGVVALNRRKEADLAKSKVWKSELWRHADDEPSREQAVKRLVKMLRELIKKAEKAEFRLAPFIGIACPGVIAEDGSIERGAQNLPGNWESKSFHLPALINEAIPEIGEHETAILMHNDAVVQGLSEVPFMREFKRWGVLTIGTGLGNARFTNRERNK